MRKIAAALLATTVMGTPVAFAASNNSQQQSPQGQQMQQNKQQTQQNNQQPQMNQSGQNAQDQNQNQQSAQSQQSQQGNQQQSAENNQPISPQNLSKNEIRQVQQALDKDGFNAGPTDGRWGPDTKNAVKQFQQSKQMQPTGRLNEQTVADLGLDTSQFSQSQNQQQKY